MLRLLVLALLAFPCLAQQRPNVLFIFTDDQAPWALGLSGHPYADTPNMDALFERGAYLTNSFTVTPVCSPSRASLFTSRYGSELGITDWLRPTNEPRLGLDPAIVTWPEILQKAGYKTGLVGKWHLGLLDRFHPTKQGFDHFMGFRGGGAATSNPRLEQVGVERDFKGLTADILTDEALDFLKNNRHETFALCIFYRAPHTRWLPVADEDWAPFADLDPEIPNPDYPNLDTERVKRMTREYLASVRTVDRNLGRVMKYVDESGLAENTIIIYSSDHGYNMGHSGVWHKGNGHYVLTKNPPASANVPDGQHPNMWDRSIKVPTSVVWPGVIEPGTRIDETVKNLDWLPTIAEMARAELPSDLTYRGRSIVPLLKGTARKWDNGLFAEYSTHHQTRTEMRMYRTPRWKLVRDFLNPERDELYDLKKDPAEATNLIRERKHAGKIRELHARIVENMRRTSDVALGATD